MKKIIIGLILIMCLAFSVYAVSFDSVEKANTFKTEIAKTGTNVYNFEVLEVKGKLSESTLDVSWVVEINKPSTTSQEVDAEGKSFDVITPGEELTTISGVTTVSKSESLSTQKAKVESEAITQAKEWIPNPTVNYKNHDLKYSKVLK